MDTIQRDWVDAIDVYSQYFHAHGIFDGSERRAAIVKLTLQKDITGYQEYQISASFFPFENEEDFLVPNDIVVTKTVLSGIKRRARKKEQEMLATIENDIDELLEQYDDAVIYWDKPLREARIG